MSISCRSSTAERPHFSRSGKDSIDHAPGAHDGVANAVAGALVTVYKEPHLLNFHKPIKYPRIKVA
jgi:hypothetical protein